MHGALPLSTGYSDVNGLKMYYEVYGKGDPLILIHGGGSTIQTSFGRVIPELQKNHQLVAMELQAHGRTSDREDNISFEQDADDVVALLNNLGISKADFFGFSNGGTTAMHIAIRYPDRVNKLVLASALAKRHGAPEQFWEFMRGARIEHMPQQYKDAYEEVAPRPENLQVMHDKCASRMNEFQDLSDDQISSIAAPTLIIVAEHDVMTPEHGQEMQQLIKNSTLAVLPGGHGEYMGEITTLSGHIGNREFIVPMVEQFLQQN